MIPKLYDRFSTTTREGPLDYLGPVSNCHKCLSTEVRNGEYTVELETSVNDPMAQYLRSQRILQVKPNPSDPNQCFEIQSTKRSTDGRTIKASAKHIRNFAYQLESSGNGDYIDQLDTYNLTPRGVWNKLFNEQYITETCPYEFADHVNVPMDFYVGFNEPTTLGNIIGGDEGSMVNIYSGELKFDNYYIHLYPNRGKNSGYPLRYGKNLSSAEQSENCTQTYSHIRPYGQVSTSTGKYYYLYGDLYEIPQHYSKTKKVLLLDCSEVTRAITVGPSGGYAEAKAAMRSYAVTYAKSHDIGKVSVSINVNVRAELDNMQQLGLCDTVSVILDDFGTVSQTAKIVSATYNVLLERWESLIIGQVPVTLADFVLKNRR